MIWLLMALLAGSALALLARPWWQTPPAPPLQRRAANVAAYRSRLTEIDADLASGLLDADAADSLRAEMGAHLLEDTAVTDVASDSVSASASPGPRRLAPLLALVLLLPLFAGAWYAVKGSWRAAALIETARRDPQAGQQLAIDAMVQRLEQRLATQPDDAKGWAMLGRSYFVMQRYADAAKAYATANEKSPAPEADWLVGEGEALALARDRDLQGRPRERFEQALALVPDHSRALWYAGLAAAQAQDYRVTQQHWLKLRQQELPEDLRASLDAQLAEIAQQAGATLPADAPASVVAAPPPVAAGSLALHVEVSLAPALAAQLDPDAALFVFAKADGGPPMPLAVRKLERPRLPVQVVLDDSLAMMPQLKLSGFDRWVVSARLSRAGMAQAQPGDLEGSVRLGRAEAGQPLRLVIDRVVP